MAFHWDRDFSSYIFVQWIFKTHNYHFDSYASMRDHNFSIKGSCHKDNRNFHYSHVIVWMSVVLVILFLHVLLMVQTERIIGKQRMFLQIHTTRLIITARIPVVKGWIIRAIAAPIIGSYDKQQTQKFVIAIRIKTTIKIIRGLKVPDDKIVFIKKRSAEYFLFGRSFFIKMIDLYSIGCPL